MQKRASNFKDLVGQRFSRLTVLREAPPRYKPCGQKSVVWLCRCDCGNEKEISSGSLRNGHTSSCGCLRREALSRANKIDLTGQRFSRLVVLEEVSRNRRGVFWRCRCDCGNEKIVARAELRSKHTRSCGCLHTELRKRRGARCPGWRGGRRKNGHGYITLLRPEFPGCESHPDSVFEHVVVMARHLGRPLHKGETVHHKNGIRDDNDIKNLELKASSHGRGQTLPDLVAWAKEILTRYGPSKFVSPCCV